MDNTCITYMNNKLMMVPEEKIFTNKLDIKNHVLKIDDLVTMKNKFNENLTNILMQNSLCANHVENVTENREYMQSRDKEFSHNIEPELYVSDQGLSGRCWLFSVLNVMRHELVNKFNLVRDFELSENYVGFYSKLEQANYFLTEICKIENYDPLDRDISELMHKPSRDGGWWISCANLIKKYGIIPKECYRESLH